MWMSWGEKCEVERRTELEEKEEGNEADRKDEKGRRRGKKILSAIIGCSIVQEEEETEEEESMGLQN